MNQLQVISNQNVLGNDFKIYGTFEEPMFLAKDVAEWIEHSNPRMMINSVDEDEKQCVNNPYALKGQQEQWFLTENGMYEVLMQSRKPIAKQFKKQVKKILKEIRQTGQYAPQPQTQAEMLLGFAQSLVDQERRQNELENNQKRLDTKINNISDIVSLDTTNWRNDVNKILKRIALKLGGGQMYSDVRTESYQLLESKARCDLNIRLTNKHKKMALNGARKSDIQKVTKLDIISDDHRLIEIYLGVVKQMAIKYVVDYSEVA